MEERNSNQPQHPEPHGQPCGRDMVDQVLLEEIELLSDVIAAVATAGGHLTRPEIDSLLGVRSESSHTQGHRS